MTRDKAMGRILRKVRFYFVLGSIVFLLQLLFAIWGYRIVAELDSVSNKISTEQKEQYPFPRTNENRKHDRPPDGSFNGYPVYYHDLTIDKTYHSHPYSSVRCVGENYQGDEYAWMHRSCHFRFMCFNVSSREFEIYSRPDDEAFEAGPSHRPFMDLSASIIPPPRNQSDVNHKNLNETGNGISLGSGTVHYAYTDGPYDGDYLRYLQETQKWFPTVVRSSPPDRYYALEENFVFVPFHSENTKTGEREYSTVWDDFFPIYTLLNMFQLVSPDKEALLMRFMPSGESMSKADDKSNLQRKIDRFRPLMVRSDRHEDKSRPHGGKTKWTSQLDALLTSSETPVLRWSAPTKNVQSLQSGLVCAKDGVAGLGPHGIRYMKGKQNRVIFHNQGKGSLIRSFRNYCVENLGLDTSLSSSKRMNVENSRSATRLVLATPIVTREILSTEMNHRDQIEIESHDFSNDSLDLASRIALMMDTNVFIADGGDATATAALFLPSGASLVVFCGSMDKVERSSGKDNSVPMSESACFEYKDLLNNMSHIFVHWLPTNSMETKEGRKILFDVVEHAIRV